MTFMYEGFTHTGNRRCFTFRSTRVPNEPVNIFSIEVDLPLLSRIRFPVQDGPRFCLQLLNTASLAGTDALDRFHTYRLVEEDFRQLLVEREKEAAERALRKPPRRPFRSPSGNSSFALGLGPREG
jgi:hypothetical protein